MCRPLSFYAHLKHHDHHLQLSKSHQSNPDPFTASVLLIALRQWREKRTWLWSKADNSLQDRKRLRVTKTVMEERRKWIVSWIARGVDLTIQASTVDYTNAISHYWLLSKIAESLSILGCPRMAIIHGLCDQWAQISAILHQCFI